MLWLIFTRSDLLPLTHPPTFWPRVCNFSMWDPLLKMAARFTCSIPLLLFTLVCVCLSVQKTEEDLADTDDYKTAAEVLKDVQV